MPDSNVRARRFGVLAALLPLSLAIAHAEGPEAKTDEDASPTRKTTGARLDYIDRILKAEWTAAKIKPSPKAGDEEFHRRAYLDLLGRIPYIEETRAFLENRDAGKRAKLIEHLLAHPDYARNLSIEWKVLLVGRQNQGRQVDDKALEDWLRRAFSENRPWDKIAYDLIAATGTNRTNGAVNFSLAHLESSAVPLTSITTRVFLGRQIQCTQCHDHPSNDWKQANFWGINAFFKGVRSRAVPREDGAGGIVMNEFEIVDDPSAEGATFERRNSTVGYAPPTFLDGRRIDPEATDLKRREALAKFITEPNGKDFDEAFVNRVWGRLMGRGIVHPVDDFGTHNPASVPELLEKLGKDFRASGRDVKQLIRWIMNSDVYQATSATTPSNERDESLFSHMTIKPMTPEQLFDSLLTATAAHKAGGGETQVARREAWLRQFQFAFANDEGEESTSFQGTIPQALMMMNGDLMEKSVGCESGSFLRDLLEHGRLQRGTPFNVYVVRHLYLAALSRYPTSRELAEAGRFLGSAPDPIGVMQDLFWALLNSNEFVLNR